MEWPLTKMQIIPHHRSSSHHCLCLIRKKDTSKRPAGLGSLHTPGEKKILPTTIPSPWCRHHGINRNPMESRHCISAVSRTSPQQSILPVPPQPHPHISLSLHVIYIYIWTFYISLLWKRPYPFKTIVVVDLLRSQEGHNWTLLITQRKTWAAGSPWASSTTASRSKKSCCVVADAR